jgi:hypothetical protein
MFAVELRLDPSDQGATGARTDAITGLAGALIRNGSLMRGCVLAADRKVGRLVASRRRVMHSAPQTGMTSFGNALLASQRSI